MKLPRIDLLDRLAAEESLAGFVRLLGWSVLEPHTVLAWNWHLDLICEHLEAVSAGQITRLVLNAAPRSMKSILVSVLWPCWSWIAHPTLSVFSRHQKYGWRSSITMSWSGATW